MSNLYYYPEYEVIRNKDKCTNCKACSFQCAFGVHKYDENKKVMVEDSSKCVNCNRCVAYCPERALKIVKNEMSIKDNKNWSFNIVKEIFKQSETGGVLLSSMGNPNKGPVYFDKILINASQVTNPPIDPIREPMETKTFLGKKPSVIKRDENGNIITKMSPQLELSMPIMFSAMSYGSISLNAHKALASAAERLGVLYNTGEGGLHESLYKYKNNTIVQVAS